MREPQVFPKVPGQHKAGKPLVPNGLGAIYVLFTTVYLFSVYFLGIINTSNGVSAPLTLAACILFGGFMGLLDDWIDVKWRHKAFLPLIAAIPLVVFAFSLDLRPSITIPLLGKIFIGNPGSFSIGITLAAFAIITDLKSNLIISILPYILNSSLILLTYFFHRTKASVSFDGKKLSSEHVRSLVTLTTYHRPLTEKQTVVLIS